MEDKIKGADSLSKILKTHHKRGKAIVFTNGCFDILHVGHVRYLRKAKSLGDILVVGLNSDESARRIKGAGRPINSEADRAVILASLYFVDYVTPFDESTPRELIIRLKPDIIVKGGDWKRSHIVGAEFVKSIGGRVVTIPFIKGYSTTSVIKKVCESIC